MKTVLSLIIGCIGSLICISAFACGSDGCSSSQSSGGCASGPGWSCDCADPACRQDNPCLNTSKCCAAFGNIGSIDGFPND